jgi:hypothetical protein
MTFKARSANDFQLLPFITFGSTGNTTIACNFNPQLVTGCLSADNAWNTLDTTDDGATWNLFAGTGHSSKNHTGTGTITSSTASATVTGTGTSFRQQISIGDRLFSSGYSLIGTVTAIASETSLTLSANASFTQNPTATYYYEKSCQWNLNFMADDDNSTNGAVRCRTGTELFFNATSATPTNRVDGALQNFDYRNVVPYNLSVSTGSRYGWMMLFKNNESGNEYRRSERVF